MLQDWMDSHLDSRGPVDYGTSKSLLLAGDTSGSSLLAFFRPVWSLSLSLSLSLSFSLSRACPAFEMLRSGGTRSPLAGLLTDTTQLLKGVLPGQKLHCLHGSRVPRTRVFDIKIRVLLPFRSSLPLVTHLSSVSSFITLTLTPTIGVNTPTSSAQPTNQTNP